MAGRQIRRGTKVERLALGGLAVAELGFETDANDIYIGSAAGDKKISGVAEWVHLSGQDQAVKKASSPTFVDLTAASFSIGANKLTTAEFAHLNGQDQAVKTTSSPRFVKTRFNPKTPQALVSFVFDDTYATDYSLMKPVFDAQGEVASSAIVTDWIDTAGFLTAAQILALESAGWEILAHSKSHGDLTYATEEQAREAMSGSKQILEGLGLTINNFVYPYHGHNEIVRRVARDYYRSARGRGGLNLPVLETYNLRAVMADDPALMATFKMYIDQAEAEKRWMIFYLHETEAADVDAVNELIDYIQAKGISIVTVNQALDLIENMIDVGDNIAIGESGIRLDGNIGIGAVPTSKLMVGGNIQTQNLAVANAAQTDAPIGYFAGTLSGQGEAATHGGMKIITDSAAWYRGRLGFFTNNIDGTDPNYPATEKVTISAAGNLGINKTTPNSRLAVVGLPSYANNAAAVAGGLTSGDFYHETGTDPLRVCGVA